MLNKKKQIGIFSFFSGAGFLDLGFEKTSSYEIMFVNEVHQPFMHIYKSSRKLLCLKEPKFGYHPIDINDYLSGNKANDLNNFVNEARLEKDLIGFIGGPPCPDFSIGGKNRGRVHQGGAKTLKCA